MIYELTSSFSSIKNTSGDGEGECYEKWKATVQFV